VQAVKYPRWEFDGDIYILKQSGASRFLMGEYGLTTEQLKRSSDGMVAPNVAVKMAAAMMGKIDSKGKWRPAKIDPLELAASIESGQEWADLFACINEASEKAPAAATATSAPPQGEVQGSMPN
jgi:hypothetical protein